MKHLAATILVCTLTQVQDPATGKLGWLEACGETTGKKHYLGHFDKDQKHALKRAKQYFKSYRPTPSYTVSVEELRANR